MLTSITPVTVFAQAFRYVDVVVWRNGDTPVRRMGANNTICGTKGKRLT